MGAIEAILEMLWPFRLAEEICGLLCLITYVPEAEKFDAL